MSPPDCSTAQTSASVPQRDDPPSESDASPASPPAKKRKRIADESDEEPQLYAPSWSCVICYSELGIDAGTVPCGITTCEPVMHMVCLACARKGDFSECPQCRIKCGAIKPLPQLVDEGADPDAGKLLNSMRYDKRSALDGQLETLLKQSRTAAKMFTDEHAAIVAKRVDFVVSHITKTLKNGALDRHGENGYISRTTMVPEYDRTFVRLKCGRQPGFQRITRDRLKLQLRNVALELQPYLDAIYADSGFKITMQRDQFRQPKKSIAFCYLRYSLMRK